MINPLQAVQCNPDFVRDLAMGAFRLFKVSFKQASNVEEELLEWLRKLGHLVETG